MTTLSSFNWQAIEQTLEADTSSSQYLLTLLNTERKALEVRDYDNFENLLVEKEQLLKNLQRNALQRTQLLHQNGFINASQLLTKAKAEAPNVAKLWQNLEQLWTECQTLNKVNEAIMQRTEIVVKRSLDLLRGQTNNTKLYGAKGTTKTVSYGNVLGSA